MEQGKVAGTNAAGGSAVYEPQSMPYTMVAMGTKLWSFGRFDAEDTVCRKSRSEGVLKKMFFEDDRLVGGADSDVISGGTGNDSLHGGGGDDIFTFCADWGTDTVEQLAEGSVTLWFESGTLENWDKETLTYTCSGNSITVTGVTADRVTLLFGDDGSAQYADIVSAGAFKGSTSEKIFEEQSLLA